MFILGDNRILMGTFIVHHDISVSGEKLDNSIFEDERGSSPDIV